MKDFEQWFEEEFELQKQQLQKPNLMVTGGTRVGKSSLINRIFGDDVAMVGHGLPVTKGIEKYTPAHIPLTFWDTEGYEISNSDTQNNTNFDTNIKPIILKMNNSNDIKDHIHLVWYCISISNHRVTSYDKNNIQWFLDNHMKVAVVFTQCDTDEELPDGKGKDASFMKEDIEKDIPGLAFFETCAVKQDIPLDLEALIAWSTDSLPNEQLRQSFVGAQKFSIQKKKDMAYKIVTAASATTAASVGFNPVPLSDSLIIVPQQMAMVIALSKIFSFESSLEIGGAVIKSQLVTLAGKQLSASLLKLIPGIGQIVNATVAASLTFGLGAALTEAYAQAYQDFLTTGKLPDWIKIFSLHEFALNIVNGIENWKKNKVGG